MRPKIGCDRESWKFLRTKPGLCVVYFKTKNSAPAYMHEQATTPIASERLGSIRLLVS